MAELALHQGWFNYYGCEPTCNNVTPSAV